MVSELSLPALRNLKKCMGVFRDLQYRNGRVRVLLNRYDPKGTIRFEDVRESLDFDLFWKIPNDYNRIVNGITTGIPPVIGENDTEIGKSFSMLCRKLNESSTRAVGNSVKGEKPGYLKRLFSKRQED